MVYFKVLLNDKREKADDIYPIVVRVTYNRNNTTFTTGIRIKSALWDATSLTVKHSHPNAQAYNKTISDFYSRLQNLAYQLINEGSFTFEDLKQRLTAKCGDSDECDHSIPAQADHPFRAKLTSAFRGKLTTPNA